MLPFDIYGIDELLGVKQRIILEKPYYDEKLDLLSERLPKNAETLAIDGSDGCGKSILALHAATAYWRLTRCVKKNTFGIYPSILYISSDWPLEQAQKTFNEFNLCRPYQRYKTLYSKFNLKVTPKTRSFFERNLSKMLEIVPISPTSSKDIAKIINGKRKTDAIYFVDLQKETAGDDWQFINRLVGLLPISHNKAKLTYPHLVIIDAVEGMEVYAGNRDCFGEKRPRRSRIAQLIRSAKRDNRTNLVFLIETRTEQKRLPEHYVADTVIHLRNQVDMDYEFRTIEVEKCRGHSHVRGRHKFVIRNGEGVSTGTQGHIDEPEIKINGKSMPYIHVNTSLHNWNRIVRAEKLSLPPLKTPPPEFYELHPLKTLLGSLSKNVNDAGKKNEGGAESGGSLTMLLGDPGSNKTRLGYHFLLGEADSHEIARVMFTTSLMDKDMLLKNLKNLGGKNINEDLLFCRRLGVRYDSSDSFIAMIEAYIAEIQSVYANKYKKKFNPRSQDNSRIRIVIDDLSTYFAAHPNVSKDPLFIQSLVFLLKSRHIRALIISTQPGQPHITLTDPIAQELRQLGEWRILTWNISFFGQKKTAITKANIIKGKGEIHELKVNEAGNIEIDNHFTLYTGIEEGDPRRVPLQVRLYSGQHDENDPTKLVNIYPQYVKTSLDQLFSTPEAGTIVKFEKLITYHAFADFATLMDQTHLDHSLIFQVDEFWPFENEPQNRFMDLGLFWSTPLGSSELNLSDKDFYEQYKPLKQSDEGNPGSPGQSVIKDEIKGPLPDYFKIRSGEPNADVNELSRKDFFIPTPIQFRPQKTDQSDGNPNKSPVHFIPYLWDFGFIAARRDYWRNAASIILENPYNSASEESILPNQISIKDIWNSLCLEKDEIQNKDEIQINSTSQHAQKPIISWPLFFDACQIVAKVNHALPFDIDVTTSESLISLMFEIWASIDSNIHKNGEDWFSALTRSSDRIPLKSFLKKHRPSLFLTMIELASSCAHLEADQHSFRVKEGAHLEPVAERHWYSTASIVMQNSDKPYSILRLPGICSTRGDWHLSVASGSRSELLAHKALDILSSRQMALTRLHSGIGLPVRDILPNSQIGQALTSLWKIDAQTEAKVPVLYGELVSIAPDHAKALKPFYRSRLKHYCHDYFYIGRFIAKALAVMPKWYSVLFASPKSRSTLFEKVKYYHNNRKEDKAGINQAIKNAINAIVGPIKGSSESLPDYWNEFDIIASVLDSSLKSD